MPQRYEISKSGKKWVLTTPDGKSKSFDSMKAAQDALRKARER